MLKTRALLPLLLLLALLSCKNKNTLPIPTPSASATVVFQPTNTPTTTPLPTPTFPIPSATEITFQEKQPILNEWTTFGSNEKVLIGEVHDIAFGVDGSIWFASMPGGLIRHKGDVWESFNPGSEYGIREIAVTHSNIVYALAWDADDNYNYVSGKFDGQNWTWENDGKVAFTEIKRSNSETNEKLKQLSYTPHSAKEFIPNLVAQENRGGLLFLGFGLNDSLWYMIQGYGFVHVYNDSTFDFYRNWEYTVPFSTINGLSLDNGNFMFSGFDGIFEFDGKTWNRINYGHSIRHDHSIIFSMKKSPSGEIWFGGVGEIFRYNPHK